MNKSSFDPPHALPSPVNLSKLPMTKEVEISLDKDQDWLKNLLNELNSQASGIPVEIAFNQSEAALEGEISRHHTHKLGEHLILTGRFSCHYFTNCVKSMSLMKELLEFEINACFIGRELETEEEYMDQTEIYAEGSIRDLYFFEKRQVDIAEMLHEQTFLRMNPYPQRSDSSR